MCDVKRFKTAGTAVGRNAERLVRCTARCGYNCSLSCVLLINACC